MTELEEYFGDFGEFVAFIEPNEDRPGVNCYVTKSKRGNFEGSSLAVVQDFGEIDCSGTYQPDDQYFIKVPQKIIDEITAWAEDNGY